MQDKDRDFKSETKNKILEGLDRPFVWPSEGKPFVASHRPEPVQVRRQHHAVDGMGQELVSGKTSPQRYWTRSICLMPRARRCTKVAECGFRRRPQRAPIHRYNPDGRVMSSWRRGFAISSACVLASGTEALWPQQSVDDWEKISFPTTSLVKEGAF
jgi:hypothetical protein